VHALQNCSLSTHGICLRKTKQYQCDIRSQYTQIYTKKQFQIVQTLFHPSLNYISNLLFQKGSALMPEPPHKKFTCIKHMKDDCQHGTITQYTKMMLDRSTPHKMIKIIILKEKSHSER